MEALAMKDGLAMVSSLRIHEVIVESDCLEVVNFCTGQSQWWDPVAAMYAEIVDSVISIGKVEFKHCRREANGLTLSFINHISCIWDDDPSSCLFARLADDVIAVNYHLFEEILFNSFI